MSNFQKKLDSLQPYVIGIRYVQGVPIVDAVFKNGWAVPDSDIIQKAKGDESVNYFMFFSDKDGIGLDELLDYVESVIHLNMEREKKQELLKVKVKELTDLFKKNSLAKLNTLKFVFTADGMVSDLEIDDMDIHGDINAEMANIKQPAPKQKAITPPPDLDPNIPVMEEKSYEDMTEEEREEEEAIQRAEAFRLMQEKKKADAANGITKPTVKDVAPIKKINRNNIELPPKKRVELANHDGDDSDGYCECDINKGEACSKCVDRQDY